MRNLSSRQGQVAAPYYADKNKFQVTGFPVWWHVSATIFFLSQHIIFFQKNIVLRTWRTAQYFLKK